MATNSDEAATAGGGNTGDAADASANRKPPSGAVKVEDQQRTENTIAAAYASEAVRDASMTKDNRRPARKSSSEQHGEKEMNPRGGEDNIKGSNNDNETANNEKQHRAWNLMGVEETGVTAAMATASKAIKVDDTGALPLSSPIQRPGDQPHPSPVFVTTGWPQRSPVAPGLGGREHRCQIDGTHTSAKSSSSTSGDHDDDEEHEHDQIDHSLFVDSFETISPCGSAIGAVQEPVVASVEETDGLLSPRPKAHMPPTEEEGIGLLATRTNRFSGKESSRNDTTHQRHNTNMDSPNGTSTECCHRDSQHHGHNTSLEGGREDRGSRRRRYHENSPASPPQRIVHVDGDDNGYGDISPIKFSPPTETTPSRHSSHGHTPRYREPYSTQAHESDQYGPFVSTPNNRNTNEQEPHAAEVSFDTSAGNTSYRQDEIESHRESNVKVESRANSRKRRAEDEVEEERSPTYSSSTFSEAKTPPRRGTGRIHSGKETGSGKHARSSGNRSNSNHTGVVGRHPYYDRGPYHGGSCHPSLYATAPRMPPEMSHPEYAGRYYHPSPEGTLPPRSATRFQTDPSRAHLRASSGVTASHDPSERAAHPSPIRPSYFRRQDSHRLYREPPPPPPPPPPSRGSATNIGGPWMGHRYSSTGRDYPPPRARLPPPHSIHWSLHHGTPPHAQHAAHPSQEITTRGHPKGRRGTAPPTAHRSHRIPPPQVPPHNPYAPPSSSSTVGPGGAPPKGPFDLLRSVCKIFQGCSYLLIPAHQGVDWNGGHQIIHTDPEDLKVARRRIESAICALGGYVKDVHEREESPNTSPSSSSRSQHMPSSNVFRRRMDYGYRNNNSILQSSSTNSSDYYRDRFHHRYFVGDHGVSWDVEENPPVFVSLDEDDRVQNRKINNPRVSTTRKGLSNSTRSDFLKQEESGQQPQASYNVNSFLIESQPTCAPVDNNQKMKYRCKLCGQPKTNHVCPYKKSLVRTLGIMVCPAVNAYNSAEPGILTPALSEMNNFVPYGTADDGSDLDTESSSRDNSSAYSRTPGSSKNVKDRRHHSPTSSSSLSTSPHSGVHLSSQENRRPRHHQVYPRQHSSESKSLWQQQKPGMEYQHHPPLFMTLALRPEHYRAVTPRTPYRNGSAKVEERDDKEEGSYEYPHVPLTFLGRKRLTDTLFCLSQSIPSVMTDVACLLRMARERDEWDLAIAEVLTQVVVCIHCPDGDYRLNGLRNYLLKIGISA